jgi:hypothetical protein
MSQSKIRLEAYNIANEIWLIGQKYVKHRTIANFFNLFFKPRLDRIILHEATEVELKDVLWRVKEKIDPLFAKLDTIQAIKDSPSDEDLTKKLMNLPDFKKLSELL